MSLDERLQTWSPRLKLAIGVIVFALVLLALYAFRAALIPLIIGSIIAYVLYPVAAQISRATRLKHGAAAAILYLLILALLVPALFILVPLIAQQAETFQASLVDFLTNLDLGGTFVIPIINQEISTADAVNQLTQSLASLVTGVGFGSIQIIGRAAQVVLYAFFTIVIAFYLTRDGGRFVSAAFDAVPDVFRDDFVEIVNRLDKVWRAFVRGQLLLSFTVFVILTILASILGLPQPLLLGLAGGLLEFLPSIGNMIWGAIAITVALAQGSTWIDVPNLTFAIIVAIAYLLFAQLDINVLIPNIIGGQVQLHPVVVLVGVIIGLSVGGVLGVALAAPTIASLRVILRYIYAKIFDEDPFPPLVEEPPPDEEETPQLEEVT